MISEMRRIDHCSPAEALSVLYSRTLASMSALSDFSVSVIGNTALRERIRAKRANDVITTDVNGVDLVGQVSVVRSLVIEGLALTDVPLSNIAM